MSKHLCYFKDLIPFHDKLCTYTCRYCGQRWHILGEDPYIQVWKGGGDWYKSNEEKLHRLPLNYEDEWFTLHLHNF